MIESATPWTHSENPARSRNIYYILYIYIFFTFFLSHFFFSSFLFKYRSIGFFVRTLSLNFFLRFFGFSRFCLNKYIHEQGTARQAEVCAPATPSFFFVFCFFFVVVGCSDNNNTPCGKSRVDLSSFFEPFPIAKRRVKSGRDAFLFFFLFRILSACEV